MSDTVCGNRRRNATALCSTRRSRSPARISSAQRRQAAQGPVQRSSSPCPDSSRHWRRRCEAGPDPAPPRRHVRRQARGHITSAYYDRRAAEFRADLNRIQSALADHQSGNQSYLDSGIRLLELASQAADLFVQQASDACRDLLKMRSFELHLPGRPARSFSLSGTRDPHRA